MLRIKNEKAQIEDFLNSQFPCTMQNANAMHNNNSAQRTAKVKGKSTRALFRVQKSPSIVYPES